MDTIYVPKYYSFKMVDFADNSDYFRHISHVWKLSTFRKVIRNQECKNILRATNNKFERFDSYLY
jgi:hypothetical protein